MPHSTALVSHSTAMWRMRATISCLPCFGIPTHSNACTPHGTRHRAQTTYVHTQDISLSIDAQHAAAAVGRTVSGVTCCLPENMAGTHLYVADKAAGLAPGHRVQKHPGPAQWHGLVLREGKARYIIRSPASVSPGCQQSYIIHQDTAGALQPVFP